MNICLFGIFFLISEFTHVMLKVSVKLAALSAEWPGRREKKIFFLLSKFRNSKGTEILNFMV